MKLFSEVFSIKKILITGDTGFKGSWLAIWLLNMGADVYGYALAPKTEKDNFVTCGLGKKIRHINGDIRDYDKLYNFFNEVKPDFAFHLAAQPLVLESYDNPKYTFETNLNGTINFFECVRKTPSIKVAINVTSDKCYQNNEWVWGYRENDPMGGKDPYSASKGCSELITHSYLNSFFLKEDSANIASARAGNVIGGGDWAENRIVPDFFRAIENQEILRLRYPEATRPWQHVLEPLSGYMTLALNLFKGGKKYMGGWNFGPIGETNKSVRELVEKMIDVTNSGSYSAPEIDEKFHESSLLNLDISKAIHYLEWRPVLNFDETVNLSVQGYTDEFVGKDLFSSRIAQIDQYCELANKRNILWSL